MVADRRERPLRGGVTSLLVRSNNTASSGRPWRAGLVGSKFGGEAVAAAVVPLGELVVVVHRADLVALAPDVAVQLSDFGEVGRPAGVSAHGGGDAFVGEHGVCADDVASDVDAPRILVRRLVSVAADVKAAEAERKRGLLPEQVLDGGRAVVRACEVRGRGAQHVVARHSEHGLRDPRRHDPAPKRRHCVGAVAQKRHAQLLRVSDARRVVEAVDPSELRVQALPQDVQQRVFAVSVAGERVRRNRADAFTGDLAALVLEDQSGMLMVPPVGTNASPSRGSHGCCSRQRHPHGRMRRASGLPR